MEKFRGVDYYNVDELLSDEERMVRDAVRDWVEAEFLPIVTEHHRAGTFPVPLIPKLGEMGVFGATLKGYGCAGLSNVAYGLIMQELERGDSGLRSCASVQSGLVMYPIHAFGQIFAGATPAMAGILPPASPSYEANFTELYPFDPARARMLLAEAGYSEGFRSTLITATAGSAQLAPLKIGAALARDLAAVGITLDIDARDDWVSYCEEWRLGIPRAAGLSEMSWGMSCDAWVEQVLHSKYLSPKGFNAGYYNRPEVDLLLDRARTEQNEAWRTALYREAHRLIMEDAAVLPVVTIRRGLVVHAPRVRNFKFPRQNWHDFRRVRLDP